MDRNIWIVSSYIKAKDNVVADPESRKRRKNLEWSLRDKMYKNLIKVLGVPEIEIFTSRTSIKISRYVPYTPDPHA